MLHQNLHMWNIPDPPLQVISMSGLMVIGNTTIIATYMYRGMVIGVDPVRVAFIKRGIGNHRQKVNPGQKVIGRKTVVIMTAITDKLH